MSKATFVRVKRGKLTLASFTLVELLTVMGIIAILAALTLAAASSLYNKAGRSRAAAEIQAMSAALEGYKADNGIYPLSGGALNTNVPTDVYNAAEYDGSGSLQYNWGANVLYATLSGQSNFYDPPLDAGKSYMTFKLNQIGNSQVAAGTSVPNGTFVKDPWGYAYGYSTGTLAPVTYPFNGNGFFDIWSTGGILKAKIATNPSLTNAWLSNWQ